MHVGYNCVICTAGYMILYPSGELQVEKGGLGELLDSKCCSQHAE